jgi:neurotransmitter:Na+ symporter, NSS family
MVEKPAPGPFELPGPYFLLMWSIPLIIAEYGIGRNGRKGVIGSYMKMAGEKFAWLGAFVGFVATAIMFYYSVVAGWSLYYFVESIIAPLPQNVEEANMVWNGFQSSINAIHLSCDYDNSGWPGDFERSEEH